MQCNINISYRKALILVADLVGCGMSLEKAVAAVADTYHFSYSDLLEGAQ